MTEHICKYNKFGYCKFGAKCQFRHINVLCLTENCNVHVCENRHPPICYYQRSYGRCKFTTFCKYSHEKEKNECENNENIHDLRKKLEEKELQVNNLESRLLFLEREKNEKTEQLTIKIIALEEIQTKKKLWPTQPYIRVTKLKPKPTFYEFTPICREDMTAHIETHNAKSRESYQFNCNLCGFVATSQENIDAHIGAHHKTHPEEGGQLESFSCDQCDYENFSRTTY